MSKFHLIKNKFNFHYLFEKLELYLLAIIEKENKSIISFIIRIFLFLLSRLFYWIILLRSFLYKKRILHDNIMGVFVVSIGNLTVGGTGKTPVVEMFARTLSKKNKRVAILSRGYKSRKKTLQESLRSFLKGEINLPRVVSEGKGKILLDVNLAGDEPYMLAKNLPNVCVLTDKNRVKSGRYAIDKFGVDTIILDDGFQRLNLKSRLNILLIDSTNPFSNHNLLPLGLLREPIENIKRADYIFLTKSSGHRKLRHLKNFLIKHSNHVKIIECVHTSKYLCDVYSGKKRKLNDLKGAKIAAISGIAVPASFENFLTMFGAEIVYKKRYVDHHIYNQFEIEYFINKAKKNGADFVVTTEKDAVRFPQLNEYNLTSYYLRVSIEILSGKENFEDCINRLCMS